jgi:hypothetical protein
MTFSNSLYCKVLKKYLPFIFLLAAGLLFYWIKLHQRGPVLHVPVTTSVPVPSGDNKEPENLPFNRSPDHIVYSKHARCRMACRHIDEQEVLQILKEGVINDEKVEVDEKGRTYPLEGITRDKQHIRVVFAPHLNELVVVTAIDLDTEWPCDCK